MKKPDQVTLKAMASLKHSQEFQVYRQWLVDSLSELDKRLRSGEGTHMARLQGEAQCLESQIDRIDSSREIAEKMER